MERIEFTYCGKVRGQGRPRFMRSGHVHPSDEDIAYRRDLRAAYLEQVGTDGFGKEPVEVHISIRRPLPKSRPKRVESEPDTCKPDADNIAKAVLDALSGLAYDDDRQVVVLSVIKYSRARYSSDTDRMHVVITSAIEEEDK